MSEVAQGFELKPQKPQIPRCIRCGRKLKNEEAKKLGMGKICWQKYNSENHYKKLFTTL